MFMHDTLLDDMNHLDMQFNCVLLSHVSIHPFIRARLDSRAVQLTYIDV